jgi:hypothetical protein
LFNKHLHDIIELHHAKFCYFPANIWHFSIGQREVVFLHSKIILLSSLKNERKTEKDIKKKKQKRNRKRKKGPITALLLHI